MLQRCGWSKPLFFWVFFVWGIVLAYVRARTYIQGVIQEVVQVQMKCIQITEVSGRKCAKNCVHDCPLMLSFFPLVVVFQFTCYMFTFSGGTQIKWGNCLPCINLL